MGARRGIRPLVWILALAVLAGASYWSMRPPDLGTRESLNILLVGVEGVVTVQTAPAVPQESRPKASFIALLSLHPVRRSAHLLLIPGETPAPVDPADPLAPYDAGRTLMELVDGVGAATLASAVERILHVPVHHTARLDLLSLAQLVDRVGGLPVAGGGPGAAGAEPELLSGEEVVARVLLENYEDAAARLAVQVEIVRGGLAVLRAPSRPVHLKALFERAFRYFETDLDAERLYAVALHLYRIPEDRITIEVLPGRFEGGTYVVDLQAAAALAARVYDNKERPS